MNSMLEQAFIRGFIKQASNRGFSPEQTEALAKTAGTGALIGQLMNTAKNIRNTWPGISKTNPTAYNKMHDTYNTLKGVMSQGVAPKSDAHKRTMQADYVRLLRSRVSNLKPQPTQLQPQ